MFFDILREVRFQNLRDIDYVLTSYDISFNFINRKLVSIGKNDKLYSCCIVNDKNVDVTQ